MSDADVHIEAWQAAGLIDRETADRLRAGDRAEPERGDGAIGTGSGTSGPSAAAELFGPSVSIAEVFGYLGGAFLLSAWFAWVASKAGSFSDFGTSQTVVGIGSGIATVALIALGTGLNRGDERRRRAAGVAFVIAIAAAGGAAASFAEGAGIDWPLVGVIGSALALATAIALRRFHPAVLTQIGLLAGSTSLAGALLSWLEEVVFPNRGFPDGDVASTTGPDPLTLVVASAVWWLVYAILVGLLGLQEARSVERGGDGSAARRAGLSRLWAGFVAVIGVAMAVSISDFDASGEYGRVLEPWVGDLGLLLVSAVLIERAFRREATSYVYAAALGLILALSDFNFTYLTDSIESGLFVEGAILLAAGVAADRLRRRVARPNDRPTGEPNEVEVAER